MRVLLGRNAMLGIKIGDDYKDVLCAMEVSLQFDHEEILTTTRTCGKNRERETRLFDWGVSVTGLSKINNTDGQISFFWLAQQSIRGSKQSMRIRYTDHDSNQNDLFGDVLIKQGQFQSVVGGFSVATHFFPGTGELSAGTVGGTTPTNLYVKYLSVVEGGWEVSDTDLGGVAKIMLVLREDGGYKEVTGTPVGRQFKYTDNTTDGKLTFYSAFHLMPVKS
jgi:hypothetical protein